MRNLIAKKIKIIIIICIVCLSISSIVLAVAPMHGLPIKKVKQQKSFWCWAACSTSVLDYYDINVTQSEIVKYIYGTPGNFAGNGYTIQDALVGWGVSSNTTTNLSFSTISHEIYYYSRPIITGMRIPGSNYGHALVVDGYDLEGGYIEYMDPEHPSYELVKYDYFMEDFMYALYQIDN